MAARERVTSARPQTGRENRKPRVRWERSGGGGWRLTREAFGEKANGLRRTNANGAESLTGRRSGLGTSRECLASRVVSGEVHHTRLCLLRRHDLILQCLQSPEGGDSGFKVSRLLLQSVLHMSLSPLGKRWANITESSSRHESAVALRLP